MHVEKITKWEKPACDNCGSRKYKVFLDNVITWEHNYKFREVKCVNCGLIYLSPRPKKAYISKFYSTETYWGIDLSSDNYSKKEHEKRNKIFGKIYRNILKRKDVGSIFDVGFGTGLFLSFFNELYWEIGGVELSKEAVKYTKKVYRLNNLNSGSIEDYKSINKFYDVVTFNSSLEHLYSPKKALKVAFKILKQDGLLVITVPNLDSLGFALFKKRWLGLHPPKHLYHFNQKTLTDMLEGTGFKVEKINHWFWHHSFYSYFESFRYMMSPRFNKVNDCNAENNPISEETRYDRNIIKLIIKKTGIIFAVCFSAIFSVIGFLLKQGEVITVYAKKY